MSSLRTHTRIVPALVLLLCGGVCNVFAQQPTPTPSTTPTPSKTQTPAPPPVNLPTPALPAAPDERDAPEGQEDVRVFTEEVRIPISATDEKGRFDPSLEVTDVLILEDDVPQEIKSLTRTPASVLLLVGTGSDLNPAVRTSTTRDIALNLVSHLRAGDSAALMQFSNRVELLQSWTNDPALVAHALRAKLQSGRGTQLSQAIKEAARLFAHQPVGNRHLVIITDGVETPGRLDAKEAIKVLRAETPAQQSEAAEALDALRAAQATVHVVSYTALARVSKEKREKQKKLTEPAPPGSVVASGIRTAGIDPTSPVTMRREDSLGVPSGGAINLDFEMRRLRKAYQQATKRSEQRLSLLTEETGGHLWLPESLEEIVALGAEVAREIGTQYVVTYRPKRPLSEASPNEYRRIKVGARRIGLQLRARRGYVVASMRAR